MASLWHASPRTCVISREKVSVRPLPNVDFLSSDWSMRLWEGQPLSFEKFLVMLLQLATVRVFFFACFQVPTFRL